MFGIYVDGKVKFVLFKQNIRYHKTPQTLFCHLNNFQEISSEDKLLLL